MYELTIIATDQSLTASERRTGSFVFTINVNNLNDNSPVLQSIGTQTVEENLPAGTIVFTIFASDLDDGLVVPLSFSIMVLLFNLRLACNTRNESIYGATSIIQT